MTDKIYGFKENSLSKNDSIKKQIIDKNIIPYECSAEYCKINYWNGKKIVLHLDHKNGVNNDQRIENLRFLCPNCHSLTDNYGSKNKNLIKKIKIRKKLSNEERLQTWIKRRKVERPSKEQLEKLIGSMSICAIGRMFGVSDNGVRKWCKFYKIEKYKYTKYKRKSNNE